MVHGTKRQTRRSKIQNVFRICEQTTNHIFFSQVTFHLVDKRSSVGFFNQLINFQYFVHQFCITICEHISHVVNRVTIFHMLWNMNLTWNHFALYIYRERFFVKLIYDLVSIFRFARILRRDILLENAGKQRFQEEVWNLSKKHSRWPSTGAAMSHQNHFGTLQLRIL